VRSDTGTKMSQQSLVDSDASDLASFGDHFITLSNSQHHKHRGLCEDSTVENVRASVELALPLRLALQIDGPEFVGLERCDLAIRR
jgi:hypothetical protein